MKKITTLLFVLTAFYARAQYSTPGTGVTWGLDELVQNSAGTVILNDDHYEITATLTILPADAIEIMDNVTVLFHDLAGIESEGTLIIDAPNQTVFNAIDSTSSSKWRGIKLLAGHVTHIRNTTFSFGGGIRVQAGTFSIEGSTLYKNYYKSGSSDGSYASSAALDLSGNADVLNCRFLFNQRGAIASGSNIACRANIRNNYIFGNTVENTNRPQINMGPSGAADTTFIVGNTVIGNGSTNAGGIAYSSLVGVAGNVVIDSNLIDMNRYGITLTGSPINGAIRYNTVTNNNIQNEPNLGGSGLNFTASSASSEQFATVTGNTISGNLWGITIIGYPQVNMGDSATATFNPGGNQFNNNGNGGILYDLYNNGPIDQPAMYNCWGVPAQDAASIETVIFHEVDDPTLGRVDFMPSCAFQTTFTVQNQAGTLLPGAVISIEDIEQPLITNVDGSVWTMLSPGEYNYAVNLDGYQPYNNSFTVLAGSNHVLITLDEVQYELSFYVYDELFAPLNDAQVDIAGQSLFTNENGIASLSLINGNYPYSVSKDGYTGVAGNAEIENGNSEVSVQLISLNAPIYTLTFLVFNQNNEPLEGAAVNIEGQTNVLITNSEGVASVQLPDGQYNYTVSLTGYVSETGMVEITGMNNSVNVVLLPEEPQIYTVTFIVDSNMGIVGGAEITINGEILITNDDGIATIELADGEYPYIASALDFSTVEGIVTVNGADVEEVIFLQTGIHNPLAAALKVYPNPVIDRLFIEGAQIDVAEVYSITGKLLLRFEQVNGFIDLRDLEQGMYLIRVKSQGLETSLRVVKK